MSWQQKPGVTQGLCFLDKWCCLSRTTEVLHLRESLCMFPTVCEGLGWM